MFELFFLYLRKEIDYRSYFKLNLSLFDSSTTFSLKINYQIQNIVKKVDPKFCVLTYEGYSWERMSINGVKKFNNKIQCVGYQHTSLTKNHYSIFNFIKGHFNPDQIWCAQYQSYKILKKKINKKFKNISLIGSFKKSVITKKINNKI